MQVFDQSFGEIDIYRFIHGEVCALLIHGIVLIQLELKAELFNEWFPSANIHVEKVRREKELGFN